MLPGRVSHHRRRGRDAGAMTRAELDVIPLARPVIGAREEELVLEVLRSGQLSLGPRVPAFEAAFAARLGAPPRLRGLVRHDRAAPRAARGRRGGGRGGRHVAVLVRRLGQRGALPGRAAGVRRHRPGHAQPGPGRRGGRDHGAHERAAARAHLRLPGRHARPGAPRPPDRGGRLRGARRRARRRHAGRRPRAPVGVRLLRQQADHDRRGRHGRARLGGAPRADRLRAQPGPRARHGLARPRPARLQLPALRHRVRARHRPARAARRPARRPRAGGGVVRRGAGRPGGGARARAALPGRGRGRPRLVRLRRAAPARRGARRDAARAARARRAVQALPAGDPPHVLLPRALRPPPGRVPGLRGRRGALARAPVLPGDDAGPGRAGGRGARRACSEVGAGRTSTAGSRRPAARATRRDFAPRVIATALDDRSPHPVSTSPAAP